MSVLWLQILFCVTIKNKFGTIELTVYRPKVQLPPKDKHCIQAKISIHAIGRSDNNFDYFICKFLKSKYLSWYWTNENIPVVKLA